MKRLDVRCPYDGAWVGEAEVTELAGLAEVGERARTAARLMRKLSRGERADILRRAQGALWAAREEFARMVALEGGKAIREARAEVERGAATLGFSAEAASALAGEEVPMDAAAGGRGRMAMTVREPVGVVAAITPFNFPLNLSLHKIGPAIAGGNAVVHKPASATPLTALRLRELFAAAGLPEGALEVAVGGGAELGAALVEAEWVNLVTFTGSAAVGWGLRARAGRKKLTLELGNNGAVVVRRDADLALAVESCVRGAYAHAGQTCISVQRIFVEAEVEQEFCRRFVEKAAGLRVGHPMAEETEMASLITENEARRVENWIAEADGEVMLQGERRGAVLGPSLVRGAAEHSKLMREEAFGPVAAVVRVKDLDEAIVRVNDSRFGLQAGIFTRDFAAAWRFAREVECGGVMINDASNFRVDQMPYGGVKESGVGREGPRYALEEMTERKLVSWRCGE